jgi:hypothetical protein
MTNNKDKHHTFKTIDTKQLATATGGWSGANWNNWSAGSSWNGASSSSWQNWSK